jgi:integrase
MLGVLPGVARVLVGVAAFTSLRRSEIRGLSWEDYQPSAPGSFGEIHVGRSVWGRRVQPTKTQRSRASTKPSPVQVGNDLRRPIQVFEKEPGDFGSRPQFKGRRDVTKSTGQSKF